MLLLRDVLGVVFVFVFVRRLLFVVCSLVLFVFRCLSLVFVVCWFVLACCLLLVLFVVVVVRCCCSFTIIARSGVLLFWLIGCLTFAVARGRLLAVACCRQFVVVVV